MSKIPILYTLGLNSNTEDNLHIIMLDFDINDIIQVKKDILNIIELFNLSSFYVLKSTQGFNAFCLDKVSLLRLIVILNNCENVDNNYILMTDKRNYSTIRIGDDKKYIMKIDSDYYVKEKSLAHKNALTQYYNIRITDNVNFDDNRKISICQYENKKYGQKIPFTNVEFKKYIR